MPDDPDHGAFVGLTDRGREQALNLGKSIASALRQSQSMDVRHSEHADFRHSESARFLHSEPRRDEESSAVDFSIGTISFFSSPVGRCMETAQNIGRGFYETIGGSAQCCATAGSHQMLVPFVEPLQPLAEFFVEHFDAYMETHKTGFYQGICRWLDGYACDSNYKDPGYFPLASRSQDMVNMMLEKGNARINIFCSHDAWIVPCLAYFCNLKFTPRLWMNFLSGMAVVTGPHGTRFVPVTGLDDGNMRF